MNADEHTKGEADPSGRGGIVGFVDWLDRKLLPAFGGAPASPDETVVRQVGEAVCPVCGRPMSEHTIDHSTRNTILHCPVEHLPLPVDDAPVNELGMHKLARDH